MCLSSWMCVIWLMCVGVYAVFAVFLVWFM